MNDLFERLADRGLSGSNSTVVPTNLIWAEKPLDGPTETLLNDVTETMPDASPGKPAISAPTPAYFVENHHYSQQTILHAKSSAAPIETIDLPQSASIKKVTPQAIEPNRPIKRSPEKEAPSNHTPKTLKLKSDDAKQTFHTTERIVEKDVSRPQTLKSITPPAVEKPAKQSAKAPRSIDFQTPQPAVPLTVIQPVPQQTVPPHILRQEIRVKPDVKPPVTITIGPIRVTAPNSVTPSVTQVPVQSRAPAGAEIKSWLGWNTG